METRGVGGPGRTILRRARSLVGLAAVAMVLAACISKTGGGPGRGWSTIAALSGGAGAPTPEIPLVGPSNPDVVGVELGQTSATNMFINPSARSAPEGTVTFVVRNTDTVTHEFVVLSTDRLAAGFPVTSFEGESNRIDEDTAGTNVGETGDMKAGTFKALTIDLKAGHYALVCNLPGHYAAGMHVDFWVTPAGATPVLVSLGDTSPTSMFIHLSAATAPAGTVAFIVVNDSTTMDHELVGFQTDTPAGGYVINGFEGDPNRFNEATAGTNVVDTGAALKPGTSQMVVSDLKAGHYALVCNLPGHYAAGMHVDFWVTPAGATPVLVSLGDTSPTSMFIHLSAATAAEGKVAFVITNTSTTMDHELVGFQTDTPAGGYVINGFEGDPNRFNEATAGTNVVDTGAALKPGTSQMVVSDLKAGHYALVCNLPGHYAAGMHVDFWVTPAGATPVLVSLGDTSPTSMFIHLSAATAPAGTVAFIVVNDSTTMDHELVGFQTDTPAGGYVINGFEGDPNRFNEATAGTNVVDTGAALKPGTSQMVVSDLKAGHYALVCNLPGHYAAGMHVDFWVTPAGATPVLVSLGDTSPTSMFIHLSAATAAEGKVAFVITNTSTTMDHELVGFQTDTPAGGYVINGFEGDPNRFNEATAGTNVVDTGAALKPGTSQMVVSDLKAGHYALVCNLPAHYAAGMHVDFWAA